MAPQMHTRCFDMLSNDLLKDLKKNTNWSLKYNLHHQTNYRNSNLIIRQQGVKSGWNSMPIFQSIIAELYRRSKPKMKAYIGWIT